MKKLIIISLLAAVGFSLATQPTYYNGTEYRNETPKVMDKEWIAEFAVDLFLDSGETGYSRAYDIAQLPLVTLFNNTSTGDQDADSTTSGVVTTTAAFNYSLGYAMMSCYDNSDETGTDSINAYLYTQISEYGAKGDSPYPAKSDAWATLHTDSIINASAAGAIVEVSREVILSNERARFMRFKVSNTSDVLIDEPRCRVYWTRKTRNR